MVARSGSTLLKEETELETTAFASQRLGGNAKRLVMSCSPVEGRISVPRCRRSVIL